MQFGSDYLLLAKSYVDGKVYVSTIKASDLKESPKWEGTENPPLSAKKAESLAREKAMQLAKKKFADYVLESISINYLRTQNVWCYEVSYRNENFDLSKIQSGEIPLNSILILVLMNGRVIEPKME
ncbi:MAG: hypothetical protein B9S32_11825 [Verrucomicrobia bacterium Tous-C9LFEB]|nr:MAG: hypothetical protein B9S32_11825 [Verrucomicrobia bacterium Tous-C9LFEB]